MRRNLVIGASLLVLLVWVLWANTALEVNEWTIQREELPSSFDGFRIAQVSDLHNTSRWRDAVEALEIAQPDIIVLTGDLIDSRHTDVDTALDFVRAALKIAPCYYVTGNHESRVFEWQNLRNGLLEAGVTVLENEKTEVIHEGESITLLGLMDPAFEADPASELAALTAGEEGFTILLSHRPELMELYASCEIGLVFAGHAHGGQVRLPIVGGLIAPDQGFFPEYDGGLYQKGGTSMLVSRGVGNSILPLRINNRPEIVVAVLVR